MWLINTDSSSIYTNNNIATSYFLIDILFFPSLVLFLLISCKSLFRIAVWHHMALYYLSLRYKLVLRKLSIVRHYCSIYWMQREWCTEICGRPTFCILQYLFWESFEKSLNLKKNLTIIIKLTAMEIFLSKHVIELLRHNSSLRHLMIYYWQELPSINCSSENWGNWLD